MRLGGASCGASCGALCGASFGVSCGASRGALYCASCVVLGGQVRVRVVIRASGRQCGCVMRGSIRVCERVVVSASGQAAKVVRKSRDEIRLG